MLRETKTSFGVLSIQRSQGDSLWSLRSQAYELRATLHESGAGQEVEEAGLLCEALDGIIQHYERCLEENGVELPYVKTPA